MNAFMTPRGTILVEIDPSHSEYAVILALMQQASTPVMQAVPPNVMMGYAPEGGCTIDGVFHPGGTLISKAAWAKATPYERRQATANMPQEDDKEETERSKNKSKPKLKDKIASWAGNVFKKPFAELSLDDLDSLDWVVIPDTVFEPAQPVQLAAAHSPEGGVTIKGVFYPGGQWIPSNVMESASADEKAKVGVKPDDKKEPGTEKAEEPANTRSTKKDESPTPSLDDARKLFKSEYDRAIDSDFDIADVPNKLAPLAKLPLNDLQTLAQENNIFGQKTKSKILEYLAGNITGRNEAFQRSQIPAAPKPAAKEQFHGAVKGNVSPFPEAQNGIIRPKNSLGVPRSQMPQIPSAHAKEFLDGLRKKGVEVMENVEIPVGRLKPTQGELSTDQMESLAKRLPPEKLASTINVSSDGYILDGHHRWGAKVQQDVNSKINTNVIDMPIRELLQEAHSFDKVSYKDTSSTGAGLPPLAKAPKLREPGHGEDMQAWLKEAMSHPFIAEAEKRLSEDVASKDTEIKWDKRPDGKWDPDRVAKVHEPIINKFVNPKAAAPEGVKPKAVFLIGPFGAGKSTAGEPIVKQMMPEYTLVNPDEIKQNMPEDEGWNATHIHEESSHISKEIAKRAKEGRHNVLFDGSGQNGEKMNKQATELANLGYEVHVVHVTVPAEVSAYRAASRFLENPFGMGNKDKKPSRYAPLAYVYNEVGSKPDQTYQMMKKNPAVKSGKSFSTHGIKLGEKVPMVDSFENHGHVIPAEAPATPEKPTPAAPEAPAADAAPPKAEKAKEVEKQKKPAEKPAEVEKQPATADHILHLWKNAANPKVKREHIVEALKSLDTMPLKEIRAIGDAVYSPPRLSREKLIKDISGAILQRKGMAERVNL